MSTDLKIFKTSFDISIYEINTDFTNNQSLITFLNNTKIPMTESVYTTFYEYPNILFDSNLINFKDFISSYLYIFCKNVLNKEKFTITESWFQKYLKDSYHDIHVHHCRENSYSLIFYVDATNNSSVTNFHIPGYPYTPGTTKIIKAEKNKLVIFPGYIPHQVPFNKDEQRIIFSANFEVLN
jgi:hypothetical protein